MEHVEEPKCLEYYDHPDYCLFRPAAWLEHREGHYRANPTIYIITTAQYDIVFVKYLLD
jgi:hypothetical protein